MNWQPLDQTAQIDDIIALSETKPQIIYKHSTTCTLCIRVKNELDPEEAGDAADIYYLDLLAHREVSNAVAEAFGIRHESPQILVIKNGKCVYHSDHTRIHWDSIKQIL